MTTLYIATGLGIGWVVLVLSTLGLVIFMPIARTFLRTYLVIIVAMAMCSVGFAMIVGAVNKWVES